MPASPTLSLRKFSVALGDRQVLRDVDLDLDASGVTVVMGHGGAGKSTLMRTLAGINDALPQMRVSGEALYLGRPLGAHAPDGSSPRPCLLGQSARLLIDSVFENVAFAIPNRSSLARPEQRALVRQAFLDLSLAQLATRLDARVVDLELHEQRSIVFARALLAGTALVMVDEPTVGLTPEGREAFLDLARTFAGRHALLFATHNRKDAERLGGQLGLLVDGRLREVAPVETFFRAPRTAAGKTFVATGSCYVDPDSPAQTEEAGAAQPRLEMSSIPEVPRGLHWLLPHALAGLPRPGLLAELDDDLAALKAIGIRALVTLEEQRTVPEEALVRFGIEGFWFPMPDMGVPSFVRCVELCEVIARLMASGVPTAVHCRAGLGRTGTILASYLVYTGVRPVEALERVRSREPRFVQSEQQVQFLTAFAELSHPTQEK